MDICGGQHRGAQPRAAVGKKTPATVPVKFNVRTGVAHSALIFGLTRDRQKPYRSYQGVQVKLQPSLMEKQPHAQNCA